MNIEEKKEKLYFLQRFFTLNFLVSFLILLLSALACIKMHDYQYLVVQQYFPISLEKYNYLISVVFGIWKVIVIQFTLVPAITVYILRKSLDWKCLIGKYKK